MKKFASLLTINGLVPTYGKILNNQIPAIFLQSRGKVSATHSYANRNALLNKFYIPKTLHVKTDQSIRVSGTKIWNALQNTKQKY